MRRIKKTKEEKEEIKKYKKEQKELMRKSRKKFKLKKEQVALLIAVIILIVLMIFLIYYVFFNKKKSLIVPDTPSYETLEVGITNDDNTTDDLNDMNTTSLSVSYNVISEYYEKNIMLSNTQVFYLNNSFMITSGPLSDDSFVSSVSLDGTLNWINKLESKEYDDIDVYNVLYKDNSYYVVGITESDDKNSISILKLNEKGTITTSSIIASNIDTKIKNTLIKDNDIAIITSDGSTTNVYFTSTNLDSNNVVKVNDSISSSESISYSNATYTDNSLKVISKAKNDYYITTINTNTYDVETSELSSVNEISSSMKISSYLNGFIAYTDSKLYKFNDDNLLSNTYDYNNLTLEDLTEYKETYKNNEYIDVEDVENYIYIESVNVNDNSIIVNSRTLLSSIYDIYDEELNLEKRIKIDTLKYYYDEGIKLNSFYIDGVIYEVYSYGTETPSIMISRIG